MSCKRRITRKPSLICAGDLNKLVKIIDRKITPDNFSFSMDLTDFIEVYAMVETRSGVKKFDGSNSDREAISHIFGIRYGVDTQKKQLVEFNGKYFEIESIENLNGENRFELLYCVELGETSVKTSWRR